MTKKQAPDKLAAALLYIAKESAADPRFGKLKLHKILFYSDFESYRHFGKSITNGTYVKFDHGPFMRDLDAAVEMLQRAGKAKWKEANEEYQPVRLVAHDAPDEHILSQEEREVLDRNIQRFWNWPAWAVRLESHKAYGWQAVKNGEEITYNMAFVGDPRPLTEDETAWALESIASYQERMGSAQENCP